MSYPQPANVAPWYLRNITQALALDETTGNVYMRTGITGDIIIEGNVNIPGNINANVYRLGNIDIYNATNTMPVSGNVTVFQGDIPWSVTGNVSVEGNANVVVIGNIEGITGNVTVTQGTTPWSITGNVTANIGTQANISMTSMNPAYVTAFEEPLAVSVVPDIQIDAVYGYDPTNMSNVSVLSGTGTANLTTSLFSASSGVTANAIGAITSRRILKYRPGQGAMCRLTASFTANGAGDGVANCLQVAGFIQDNQAAYGIGFSGDTATGNTGVGILHMYNGIVDVHSLTVTTAAGGVQTGNVTLNGTSYTVPLTNTSGNTQITAAQIATGNTWGGLWKTGTAGNVVYFTATQAGPKSGSYSFSSTGAGNIAAGTIAQVTAGAEPTREWTYQANWNGTPVTFDPQYLNVYGIDFRWLGAGIVRFFMEDPATGAMTLLHTQNWANQHNIPHQNNPSFRVGIMAENIGGASTGATVTSASMMAAIQGQWNQTAYSTSWSALDSSTRAQNTLHHVLSIFNPYQRSGKLNMQEVLMESLSVALQNQDPATVYMFINAAPSTPLIFNAINNSFVRQSTTTATFSTATDTPVAVFTVGINGNSQFDLTPYNLVLDPGDTLSIGIYSTNSITNSAVGLIWTGE